MTGNMKRTLACVACAKAKSRCIPGPEAQGKCERCHRLCRECIPRAPVPPRRRNPTRQSVLSQLERRLRVLEGARAVATAPGGAAPSREKQGNNQTSVTASLCTHSVTWPPSSSSTSPTPAPAPASRNPCHHHTHHLLTGSFMQHIFAWEKTTSPWPSKETVAAASSSAASPASSAAVAAPVRREPLPASRDSMWPTLDESELLLEKYNTLMAHLLPFVVIPRDMSAAEMKRERPFLYKAVMMAACFLNGTRHRSLGGELLGDVVRAAMFECVRSCDLLQAMLVLISWFHLKSPVLMNMLFLARSTCLSLGLGGQALAQNANLDHLRAYAGTYYLNTLVLTTNKNTEVLMSTSFLENSCGILEAAKQHESDEYLVKLVRAQLIAQSISLTLAHGPGAQQPMQLPITIVVRSFQDRINALRQSLTPKIGEDPILQSLLSVAEILLTEWAASDRLCNETVLPPTDRLALLWSCVCSLRDFFATRLRLWDDSERPPFLAMHSSDLAYALLTGMRIITLRLPGWNLEHIERELTFSNIMDSVVSHLGDLAETRRRGTSSTALLSWRRQLQQQQQEKQQDSGSGDSDGNACRQKEGGGSALADKPSDPIEGLLKLCIALRSRVRAEMARALADCKARSQSWPPDQQQQQQQQQQQRQTPASLAAMEALGPPHPVPPGGVDGDSFMVDVDDTVLRDYISDAFWSGTGDLDDFLLYEY